MWDFIHFVFFSRLCISYAIYLHVCVDTACIFQNLFVLTSFLFLSLNFIVLKYNVNNNSKYYYYLIRQFLLILAFNIFICMAIESLISIRLFSDLHVELTKTTENRTQI